jgi:succinate dehydrogenase/fumarate reductase flavoprotein subunit
MADYAGPLKSATMLESGLRHLRRLRERARGTLKAVNPHEVSRSMEVFNLLDLGELVLMAAMDRKESRGSHVRSDCPYTNPLWNEKLHVLRRVDGKAVFEWREKRN